jgi:hypothetical protein
VKLSATIMAHPARERAVGELQAQLDRELEVIWDENPVPSKDPMQRWAVGRRAWEAHDPTADWHLVIQDDVFVSKHLMAGLERALDELGKDGLVSAYTGTGRPDQANVHRALAYATKNGYTWMTTRSLNWGPAILAPVHTIPAMLKWCSHSSKARGNYDWRIGVYYRDVLKWRTWYTNPSLVEHRGLPSLCGHDTGPVRKAHRFHEGSALDINWAAHGGLDPNLP